MTTNLIRWTALTAIVGIGISSCGLKLGRNDPTSSGMVGTWAGDYSFRSQTDSGAPIVTQRTELILLRDSLFKLKNSPACVIFTETKCSDRTYDSSGKWKLHCDNHRNCYLALEFDGLGSTRQVEIHQGFLGPTINFYLDDPETGNLISLRQETDN